MKRMRNRTMGILIQERDTKQFYKNKGSWTEQRAEAISFENCAAALTRIREEKLQADILLAFNDSSYDITIPWG